MLGPVAMELSEILIAIAQVAVGGGIVQGALAWSRRRSELRQLDRQTDSVAVGAADTVVTMLRTELQDAKVAAEETSKRNAAEQADLRRQIQHLGEEVSRLRADLVIARAEIARLKSDREGELS
ncbi:hypothetical protein Psi01_60810 [Planobispora siamensis]|uniref:Uncharacterized protein n=1 Tax=Planobispora siamensis TaxID=936338 RepID=A0A8J3SMT0_9ACTN|nr:hypothetical protein Psi01_60810 [Planobispora siamensis]